MGEAVRIESRNASIKEQSRPQQAAGNYTEARRIQFSRTKLTRGIHQGKTYAVEYHDIQVVETSKYIDFFEKCPGAPRTFLWDESLLGILYSERERRSEKGKDE